MDGDKLLVELAQNVSALQVEVRDMKTTVEQINHAFTILNGRLRAMETWRAGLVGGFIALAVVVGSDRVAALKQLLGG